MSEVDDITRMKVVRLRQRLDQARAQACELVRNQPGDVADIWELVLRPGFELRHEPCNDTLELVGMFAMLGIMEAALRVSEPMEPS